MDKTTVKMHVFLDTCWEIERTCAALYFFFADHFADDLKIARLWSKTAMEEENHALQIELAKKLTASISWVSIESWQNAGRTLGMIRNIAGVVRQSPPTLKEAIMMSLTCEARMLDFHVQNAILMDDATNRLFAAMEKEDRDHVTMLEAVLDAAVGNSAYSGDIIELEELREESLTCQQADIYWSKISGGSCGVVFDGH